jgi:acyl carrier protein
MTVHTATAETVRAALADMLSEIKHYDVRADLGRDDNFMRVLNLDSLDAVELTVKINERFGLEFGADPNDLDALENLTALVDLVQRRATR